VKTHYFGVNEFLERFNEESIEAKVDKKVEKPKEKSTYHQSKEEKAAVKKCENRIKKAERQIESLEAQIAIKSKEIAETVYDESTSYQKLSSDFDTLKTKLEAQMQEWENAASDLEELNAKLS
jgi:ATP-binding cassette subfamily F protein 3